MRQLNTGNTSVLVRKTRNPSERLDVRIAPNAVILRADAAFRRYGARFHDHRSGAPDRAAPEMHEVPIRREAIHARILAHRRHHDPIAQRHTANLELGT
jgi:hypothetical protein